MWRRFEELERRRGPLCEYWTVEDAAGNPCGEAYFKAECEYWGYRAEKMVQIDIKLSSVSGDVDTPRMSYGRSCGIYSNRVLELLWSLPI
jgi:hypothetical protein